MIKRSNNENAILALIAIFAVLISFAQMDVGISLSSEAHAIVDLGHEQSQDQHAHGCGICHSYAHVLEAGMKVEPDFLAVTFGRSISELSPQFHSGPPLRPPSA